MNERGAARNWVIAYVVAAVVGLGALIGIGKLVGANKLPGEAQAEQTTTDGKQLFLANCAVCHGINGQGVRGPSLVSGEIAALDRAELQARIADGKPLAGMPKFERSMSPEQLRAVAEYVVSLREAS